MSQIEDLQGRIAAALDRIGQGIDRMGQDGGTAPGNAPGDAGALQQQLEDEQIANEQLQERVKKLQIRRQRLEEELQTARDTIAESLTKFDSELQGLRTANDKLRDINAKLRDANAAGLGDADLINKGLEAELEALRATRAADRAETEMVYTELSEAVDNVRVARQAEE